MSILHTNIEKITVLNLRATEQSTYWKRDESSGIVCVEFLETESPDKSHDTTTQETLQIRLHDLESVDDLINTLQYARLAFSNR